MAERYKTEKGWRCEKKTSNHRRAHWLDYQNPATLLLTLVTTDRLPLFGYLQGEEIVRTALGQRIAEEIEHIPTYKNASAIEIYSYVVMPDHVHILLHIHERLPKHIGQYIGWFKRQCTLIYQQLITGPVLGANSPSSISSPTGPVLGANSPSSIPSPSSPVLGANSPSSMLSPTGPVLGANSPSSKLSPTGPVLGANSPSSIPSPSGSVLGANSPSSISSLTGPVLGANSPSAKVLPFAPEYHDRILTRKGQLANMKRYIQDNPRRLALKRANKELFKIHQNISLNHLPCTTLGNMFLADYPIKQVIQCSRRLTQEQIDTQKAQCLANAAEGVVYITGAISEGEKQIAQALRENGYPLIVILHEGFPKPEDPHYRYFKPQGVYFEACAAGKLLLIEPDKELLEREDIVALTEAKVGHIPHESQRYRFVAMNMIADEIARRINPEHETD